MNEQTQFKIDTSGAVQIGREHGWRGVFNCANVTWSDLSPFQQGAEGEARRELAERLMREGYPAFLAREATAFSRWAPSALQRIMADCDEYPPGTQRDAAAGARFWRFRNTPYKGGIRLHSFPPLTISLTEDGLIHLSEVG